MSKEIRRHIDSFRDFRITENKSDDEYINYLLDKISKKGIDSLSDIEKRKLSDLSQGNVEDRTLRIIDGEIYIGRVAPSMVWGSCPLSSAKKYSKVFGKQ